MLTVISETTGVVSPRRDHITERRPFKNEMNEPTMTFTVSLADVPIRIICRHEGNKAFLQDYLTGREPLLTIEPTKADLAGIQQELDRIAEAEGNPKEQHSDFFLENNAIHALVAERLLDFNTLLIHGSALCMDGQAYLFIAPSGTGKSTHSRLWREAFGDRVWMINDDKPLIRFEDGRATVYGSPWDGKHHLSRNASAPLKAIVSLHRDRTNHIEAMRRQDAFLMLLRQRYSLKDDAGIRRIIALKTALLDTAAFYRLYCNMETEAAWTAWKGVSGT